MTLPPALEGLVVLEVSEQPRGRYCGRLFAEMGATVVRVVPVAAGQDADASWLDPGKHMIALATDAAEGRSLLQRLLARADVLLEDVGDAGLAARGLDAERIAVGLPALVHCTLTPFGLDGPWAARPASDIVVAALSGMCAINGFADGDPLREPGPQAELVAAWVAFIGALAALEDRQVTRLGQRIDVSALEAMLNVLSPTVLQQSYQGKGPPRGVREGGYLFPCADGWMSLIISANKAWETIVEVLEVPIAEGDDRFKTEASRRQNAKAVREILSPILLAKTRAELFHLLAPMRVVCGMVMAPVELLEDDHLRERGAFVEVERDGEVVGRVPRVAIRTIGEERPARLILRGPGQAVPGLFQLEAVE